MATFLTEEQQGLALEIAALLTERGETVAVAESTTGGLISAALLWVPGASKYYAGGGVFYTLKSRVALGGLPASMFADYRGTTPEMIAALAESVRSALEATWCIAESGIAGPSGGRSGQGPGQTVLGLGGPVSRTDVIETEMTDREANMSEFATRGLKFLRDAVAGAPKD